MTKRGTKNLTISIIAVIVLSKGIRSLSVYGYPPAQYLGVRLRFGAQIPGTTKIACRSKESSGDNYVHIFDALSPNFNQGSEQNFQVPTLPAYISLHVHATDPDLLIILRFSIYLVRISTKSIFQQSDSVGTNNNIQIVRHLENTNYLYAGGLPQFIHKYDYSSTPIETNSGLTTKRVNALNLLDWSNSWLQWDSLWRWWR